MSERSEKKPCSVDGCDRPTVARSWCQVHYMRWKRHGDAETVTRPYNPQGGECSVDGCDRPADKRGWCDAHYQRWHRGALLGEGIPEPIGECSVDGCDRPHKARGLCDAHYQRWRQKGDPGPADLQAKTPLPDVCVVDGCDRPARASSMCGGHYTQVYQGREVEPLRQYGPRGGGWVTDDGYHCFKRDGRTWFMHRWVAEQVLGRPILRSEEVHHVNGDKLNNEADGPFVMDERGRLRSGNLEVWSTSQPPGQEVGPKVEWARALLGLYGDDTERATYAPFAPSDDSEEV